MEQDLPIRCRAEEVTAQLLLVLAGMPFLAERSWQEVGWGRMRIELLSLWRIELLLEPGLMVMAAPNSTGDVALSRVERAAAPDGRCWVYGCQRDDCEEPAAGPIRSVQSRRLRWLCWRSGSAPNGGGSAKRGEASPKFPDLPLALVAEPVLEFDH